LRGVVIDASVALKWYLDDEEHGQKAMNLLTRFIADELDILAPSLLEYEVVNGLIIARKRGRIEEEKVLSAIEGFASLGIRMVNLSPHYSKVIHFCKTYNRSAYDASYMVVAESERMPFITADEGLCNAVKKDLKWVKWLGDIPQ
jgi:predicted nucleic acid-binding protein